MTSPNTGTEPGAGGDPILDALGAAETFVLGDGDGSLDGRLAHFARNDLGNARRLTERFGADLLMVRDVGWHVWDGRRWNREEGETRARQLAHRTATAIGRGEADALEAEGPRAGETLEDHARRVADLRKWGSSSSNTPKLSAMLTEAAVDQTVAIEAMDARPALVAALNGTLDLASDPPRLIRPHDRRHRISRLLGVAYDPAASAPLFDEFLQRILPDQDAQAFLQAWFGHNLTGDTGEQLIVCLWGKGANGKSTLLGLLEHVFGDYALTLPFASLIADDRRRGAEATPDLARLPGRRLVIASEPEVGARFSESMLKSLTGGDTLSVRHLNKGFFDFKPQFKLTLAFNSRPQVRGIDEGIWRRLALLPFEQTIPPGERDAHLPEKLRGEAPGVLNWLIEGWRRWRGAGRLAVPEAIRRATQAYREESDPVGAWLDYAIEIDPASGAYVTAKRLLESYQAWCKDNGVEPVTTTLFGRMLSERGIPKRKSAGMIIYTGVKLSRAAHDRVLGAHSAAHDEVGDVR